MTFDLRTPSAPVLLATYAQDGNCLPSNGLAWDVEERNGNLHVEDGPAGHQIVDSGECGRLDTERIYRCTGNDDDAGDCFHLLLSGTTQYDQDNRMRA